MTKNKFLNILILVLVFLVSGAFQSVAQDNKKQLIIINSYNEVAPWPRKYMNKVIQDVSARPDFKAVRVIHLNNSLIFNQEDYNNLVSMLFDYYTGAVPDYIVLIGNFAFNLRDKIK